MSDLDDLRAVGNQVRQAEACRMGDPELSIAEDLVASLPPESVRLLATEQAKQMIWAIRRDRQLAVERRAQAAVKPVRKAAPVAPERQPAVLNGQAVQDERFQLILDDPGVLYGARSRRAGAPTDFLNSRDRKRFRSWCGKRFDDWLDRAERVVDADPEAKRNIFVGDWHPDGVQGAAFEAHLTRLGELVETFASEIRLELTEELLGTQFAIGDGRRTTWAEATVADHQDRVDMLTRNAAGNVEAAARHRAAMAMLNESGAASLGEVARAESLGGAA